MNEKQRENVKTVGLVLSLGFTMAASVVVGFFTGSYLDAKFETEPIFTIIMLCLGVVGALKSAYDSMFSK